MKRIFSLAIVSFFSLGAIYAQGQMDAYKFSKNELRGTARSVAMGGAFGALGGDISAISINPAGIGVYRTSEVVTTLSFENTRSHAEMNLGRLTENRFKFNFDNLGFVSTFPLQSDVVPSINIGFTYNRLKNFDRRISVDGQDMTNDLTDYMAGRASVIGVPGNNLGLNGSTSANNVWRNEDWLSVLGYNAFLIDQTGVRPPTFSSSLNQPSFDNHLFWEESGSINTYDFNMGATFADMLSWGMTLSVTDISYNYYSSYSEDFFDDRNQHLGGYDLINGLRTRGNGWQMTTGIIFKPVHAFRIGVAYHSPTWYNMTDTYWADLAHDINSLTGEPSGTVRSFGGSNAFTDYRFRTPDKWTFSAAGVIGKAAIVSVDYELQNYGRMRLHNANGRDLPHNPNEIIPKDFRNASTLRAGLEYRVTPQLSARVGYAWMQSPLDPQFRNNEFEVETVGSIPHYILDGDVNTFTYGFGYRFSRSFYSDVAFQLSSQKSDLYMFSNVFNNNNVSILDASTKSTLNTNKFQGLLTLGYRF